ncbi:hypothetical protein X975_06320, partial [Stegodyphus mimosarum]
MFTSTTCEIGENNQREKAYNWQITKELCSKPCTSLAACAELLELAWEIMSHPAYCPNLVPSDYQYLKVYKTSEMVKHFVITSTSNCT